MEMKLIFAIKRARRNEQPEFEEMKRLILISEPSTKRFDFHGKVVQFSRKPYIKVLCLQGWLPSMTAIPPTTLITPREAENQKTRKPSKRKNPETATEVQAKRPRGRPKKVRSTAGPAEREESREEK